PPPALLIQGTADNNVTPDMPDRFVAAYSKAGGKITPRKFEGEPHTFIVLEPTSPASVEAIGLVVGFVREPTQALSGVRFDLVVSRVYEVVGAFRGCDGAQDWTDSVVDGFDGSLCGFAKPVLELGEELLDRV